MKRSGFTRKKYEWKRSGRPLGFSGRLKTKRDPELAKWKREALKRDENRCQFPGGCFTGDLRIDAHHIAKRSQRPDLKYELSNGIALCRTHHDWTDHNHDEAIRLGLLSDASYEKARKAA